MDDLTQFDEELLASFILDQLYTDKWTSVNEIYCGIRKRNDYPNFFKLKKNKHLFNSFCETLEGRVTDCKSFECSIKRNKKTLYLKFNELPKINVDERTIHEICRDGDVDAFIRLNYGEFIYYEKEDKYGATILDAIDDKTDNGVKILKFIIKHNNCCYDGLKQETNQIYHVNTILCILCFVIAILQSCTQK